MTDTKIKPNESYFHTNDVKQGALNNSLDTEFGALRTNFNTNSVSLLHDNSQDQLTSALGGPGHSIGGMGGPLMTITNSFQ